MLAAPYVARYPPRRGYGRRSSDLKLDMPRSSARPQLPEVVNDRTPDLVDDDDRPTRRAGSPMAGALAGGLPVSRVNGGDCNLHCDSLDELAQPNTLMCRLCAAPIPVELHD